LSESQRQQTHWPWTRETQLLDDDAGLDDVALAVDQQRELAAASDLRQSPRLRVAATGSSRPLQLATGSCPVGDALHWCYATTASTSEYCEAV
jgi:hypothetical protein